MTEKRKIKVLIADDDIMIRELMSSFLAGMNCGTELYEDGETALVALSSNKYDLAFLDVIMPNLSGLDCCKEFRKFESRNGADTHLTVIAVTGNYSDDGIEKCIEAGMDEVLEKPFSMASLREILVKYEYL